MGGTVFYYNPTHIVLFVVSWTAGGLVVFDFYSELFFEAFQLIQEKNEITPYYFL